ncbi:MAG TPA: LysE family translocator [Myxococcota bacterium]|nr:LysE family translocator [Myxococcota bacterium]
MSLETWVAFCATETVLCFTPGPAVLFVVSVALARGARPGMAAASGILTANACYFALSATGIAAVILASGHLFTALRWAGAGYLVWVGLRMLLSRPSATAAERADAPPSRPVQRAFLRALVVQGANPKALIFFVALLPQFIDASAPVGFQLFILGASSIVIEFFVLLLYVVVASRSRRLAGARLSGPLERIGGSFLLAAGARLALLLAR